MKRLIKATLLLCLLAGSSFASTDMLFPVLNSALLSPAPHEEFTFGVFGDFRPPRRDLPYPAPFNKIMDELGIISPAFVISTGDLYYGYNGSLQRFRNEVARFMYKIREFDVPFYSVIGNHDTPDYPRDERDERTKIIRGIFGKFYGSFDYGSAHFIMLNTEERGREGAIAGDQMEWLKKDLELNKNAGSIFVFMHRPLFSIIDPEFKEGKSFIDKANRDALHELFVRCKVRIVFAGHEHLFGDMMKDGVRYMVTAGGGAPLVAPADKGGFFHYAIVHARGSVVKVDVVSPPALHVRVLEGNDGFQAKTVIEVSNISNVSISARNFTVLMPAASDTAYTVEALTIPNIGAPAPYPVQITRTKENRDGTKTIGLGMDLAGNGVLRVTVTAAIDK